MRPTATASFQAVFLVGLVGCVCPHPCPPGGSRGSTVVEHFVLFKLHDPALAGDLLADCHRLLPGIPGVTTYYGGRHVETGRPTVDAGYDAAIGIGFDSLDAYSSYVSHPDHQALVNTWRPRLEWLRVYDIGHESPDHRPGNP